MSIKSKDRTYWCSTCLNVFPETELRHCWIYPFESSDYLTIVTRTGVKYIRDRKIHCKMCLETRHQHIGVAII